jgi:hypothetical protein
MVGDGVIKKMPESETSPIMNRPTDAGPRNSSA